MGKENNMNLNGVHKEKNMYILLRLLTKDSLYRKPFTEIVQKNYFTI